MRRIPNFLGLLAMTILSGNLVGCGPSGLEEAISEADYFVLNQRTEMACLSAKEVGVDLDITFTTPKIPSGEQAHIYHAWEGSGGHTLPSNFFGTFKAVNCADSTDIFYEGVVNADWKQLTNDRLLLTLAPP